MNRNSSIRFFIIILLVLSCIGPEVARADEPFAKVGSYAATFLRFPRGTRSIALGGCGTADPSNPMNVYYNPGVAFLTDDIHAVYGYNKWPGDVDFQDYGAYAGRSFSLGPSSQILIGGGIRYTHLKMNIDVERTIFLPGGTGRTFDAKDYYLTMTAGAGIGTRWIDAGVGLSAKPTKLGLDDKGDWIWIYDVGLLAKFNLPDVSGVRIIPSIGASILNVNDMVDYHEYRLELPDEVRAGIGLRIESGTLRSLEERLGVHGPAVAISGIYGHMDRKYNGGKDGSNYGVELTLIDALSMRIGHSDQIFGSGGTTYGIGIGWWFSNEKVDYTLRAQFDWASFPISKFIADERENMYGVSIIADI